ncbi:MAG: hypothetical protein AABX07_02525 [Nanoarchaeota archaeon]
MITLFQIDKSGRDIFEKDYAIVIIVDKKEVYGVNLSQDIRDNILHDFRSGELNIKKEDEKMNRTRLRIRFHTAVIVLLLKRIISKTKLAEKVNIEICNDFDGHFHEIKDMIYKHICQIVNTLKPEDIVLSKFYKPSLIDTSAQAVREREYHKISNFSLIDLDYNSIKEVVRK